MHKGARTVLCGGISNGHPYRVNWIRKSYGTNHELRPQT
jgi:hypothetical protein